MTVSRSFVTLIINILIIAVIPPPSPAISSRRQSRGSRCGGSLPSNRQHLSSAAARLEDKREDNPNCSLLCCIRLLCTHTCEHFVHFCMLVRFRFLLVCLFRFCLLCFLRVSLDDFVLLLLAFVMLGLVSSVLSQEIGWEERL